MYFSPEILSNKGVNYKSDIYQIGLIIYELYSSKIAFKNNNLKIIYDNIKNNRINLIMIILIMKTFKRFIIKSFSH